MRATLPVLLALLAAGLPAGGADPEVVVTPHAETTPPAPHPAILVAGDAGFLLPTSGVRSGAGTAEDPYRIADWTILRFSAYGIRLVGTRAHVVIENVFLEGEEGLVTHRAECLEDPAAFCRGPQAINLVGAENVTIRNVRFVASSYGLRATDASRLTVVDSVFGSATSPLVSLVTGVALEHSRDVTIANTSFLRVLTPLSARDSSNVRMEWSTVAPRASADAQLVVRDVNGLTFAHNDVTRGRLFVEGQSSNLTIAENGFDRSAIAGPLAAYARATDVLVCGNVFRGAVGTGPSVAFPDLVRGTIARNQILDGHVGLHVNNGSRVVIEANRVTGHADRGAQIVVPGAEIRGNHFEGNRDGVRIVRPANATLNWWGAPDGPSGDGPGSGDRLLRFGSGAVFAPWLSNPPSLDFDCVPGEGAGAGPAPAAVLRGSAGASVEAQAGGESRSVEAGSATPPAPLPW